MKSISFVGGLFFFFSSIILSMIWIIVFQYHSDQFLFHSKQLHRTLSMTCLNHGCSELLLKSMIEHETLNQWPNASFYESRIVVLLFDPLVLEIEIEISVPALVKDISLKYSKIMIEERK